MHLYLYDKIPNFKYHSMLSELKLIRYKFVCVDHCDIEVGSLGTRT